MKNIIKILIAVILIGSALIVRSIYFAHNNDPKLIDVDIKPGSTVRAIAAQLADKNVITSQWWFQVYMKLTGDAPKIKAGTYAIAGNLSIPKVVEQIISGNSQTAFDLTIPEGWNLYDIANLLVKRGVIKSASELYDKVGYPAKSNNPTFSELIEKYPLLAMVPKGNSLEGMLFPDTYRYYKDASLDDVLKKIFANAELKFDQEIKPDLGATTLKPYEVYILASIISREGKSYEDKQKIAGVFLNRLNIGMALQSDPTVNYVTGKTTDNPSLDDIAIISAYNTYKNSGLPPGPIANPGLDDLKAILHPVKHDYYFFINDKAGNLIYSKTFEEHKQNRIKYGQ